MTKRDIATYLVGVLLLGGIATGVANANTTTTGSLTIPGLAGCLSNNGTLSNVKFSDVAPASCSNGKGVAWGLQGPRGLDGAPGLQGKSACSIWNDENTTDMVDCTTSNGRKAFLAKFRGIGVCEIWNLDNPTETVDCRDPQGRQNLLNKFRGQNGSNGSDGRDGSNGSNGRDGVVNAGFAGNTPSNSNFVSDSNKVASAIAMCAAGKVAVGGGYTMESATNSGYPVVVENQPVMVGDAWGWKVTMRVPSENSKVGRTGFTVQAVCADNATN